MLLIINADDLGASMEVNNAIFELISNRSITSSTMIANAPHVEDAAERAYNYPDISFGIHLNLTSFAPLSNSGKLRPVLDLNGQFADRSTLVETPFTKSLSNAIYSEFCKQVDKLKSLGVKISHIDSHEHIHTVPKLFTLLKRLQKQYDMRKVRISRNVYLPDYRFSRNLAIKKKIFNFLLKHYYSTTTTSGFGNLMEFYNNAVSNKLPHNSMEIMVHPGADKFKDETSLLKHQWQKKIPFDMKFINYNQL